MFLKKINELPGPMSEFIHAAGHLADKRGLRVYVVGGFVRDMMLGVENFDVDLVVEGDGIAFAAEYSHRHQLKVVVHKRFRTATILGFKGFKVDIASARREIYESAAELPVVFDGNIEDDLFRRDFTINAMAISINKDRFGEVVDVYKGRHDLKAGLVRAMHRLSFVDDPTRILRAVRFEQRFDFKIEKNTLSWLKRAVRQKMLHHVQKHRLRDELILIFKECLPGKSLKRLYKLCGFSYIALHLRFQNQWNIFFNRIQGKIHWFRKNFHHKGHIEPYIMYMSLFFFRLTVKDIKKVAFDFAFHKKETSNIISLKENFRRVKKELTKRGVRPSTVYRLLEPLGYETILLIMVLAKNRLLDERVEDFLFCYKGQRLGVRGEDLSRLGIKPGPHYKRILSELLYAKIDGKVKDKPEELKLALRLSSGR